MLQKCYISKKIKIKSKTKKPLSQIELFDTSNISTIPNNLIEDIIGPLAFNFENEISQEVLTNLVTYGLRNSGIQKEIQKHNAVIRDEFP